MVRLFERSALFTSIFTRQLRLTNTTQTNAPYSPDGTKYELRVAKAVCFGSTTNAACSADSQGNADGTRTVSFEYTTTVADVGLFFAPLYPVGPAAPAFKLPITGYSAAMCPSGYEVRLSNYYFVSTA